MITIIEFLKGKKTYIIGILSIILGLLNGDNQLIMTGFGLMTLRAGITNTIVSAVKGNVGGVKLFSRNAKIVDTSPDVDLGN